MKLRPMKAFANMPPLNTIDPLEVSALAFIGLGTLAQLIGATSPNAIAAVMNLFFQMVWLAFITSGCIIGLLGIFWPFKRVDGMLMERVGIWWASGGLFIYGAAQAVSIWQADLPIGSYMSPAIVWILALGLGVKARRIQKAINILKKVAAL